METTTQRALKFLFPTVQASYSKSTLPYLFWVPKPDKTSIPCLFEASTYKNDKIALYFHGNGEDIGDTKYMLEKLAAELRIHFVAMEYPGYGLYQTSDTMKPIYDQIEEDAQIVYDFLKEHWTEENVFVFGRSTGSGPACYLAAKNKPAGLILLSAYISIRENVKGKPVWWLPCDVGDFPDIFVNSEKMKAVECPALLIHGEKDTSIRPSHSETLAEIARKNGKNPLLKIQADMTHNNFMIDKDIAGPVEEFFKLNKVEIRQNELKERFFQKIDQLKDPKALKEKSELRVVKSKQSCFNFFKRC